MSKSTIRVYELANELGRDCRTILYLLGDERGDLTDAQYTVVKPRAVRKLRELLADGNPPPGPYVHEMRGGIQRRTGLTRAETARWKSYQHKVRSLDWSRRRSRTRDARARRAASSLACLAALIAGPAHPWTLEAWNADLIHGPHGRKKPFGPWPRILYSLGLTCLTAPRLRIQHTAAELTAWAGRQLDKILASNAKTATVATLTIAVLLIQIDRINGLATTTTAVTLIPASCAGIKWLRRYRLGPKSKDTHTDDSEHG